MKPDHGASVHELSQLRPLLVVRRPTADLDLQNYIWLEFVVSNSSVDTLSKECIIHLLHT